MIYSLPSLLTQTTLVRKHLVSLDLIISSMVQGRDIGVSRDDSMSRPGIGRYARYARFKVQKNMKK